jgi:hypothetical protein
MFRALPEAGARIWGDGGERGNAGKHGDGNNELHGVSFWFWIAEM